jgi:hypothetical protein
LSGTDIPERICFSYVRQINLFNQVGVKLLPYKLNRRIKMKIRIMIMMVCVLAFTSAAFAQKGKTDKKALPAQTITFNGGTCTAKFVRSASGIINETNRDCAFGPYQDVKVQFRPVDGTPNPECDPEGLLYPSFQYTNTDPAIASYFGNTTYNVCVYLASPASTGNLTFNNGGFEATVTYAAGNTPSTTDDPLAAQGTLTYSDSRITYTTNVLYVKTVGNTTYLVGQVTAVNGQPICCSLGN